MSSILSLYELVFFYRSECTCINRIITLQLVIEDCLVLFYSQRAFHPLEGNQRFSEFMRIEQQSIQFYLQIRFR